MSFKIIVQKDKLRASKGKYRPKYYHYGMFGHIKKYY